jgi:hypothetical protein
MSLSIKAIAFSDDLDDLNEGRSTSHPNRAGEFLPDHKDGGMEGQLVMEFELPPGVAEEINQVVKSLSKSKAQATKLTEQARLRYLFHGRAVLCAETKQGLRVFFWEKPGMGSVRRKKAELPEPIRDHAKIIFPEEW